MGTKSLERSSTVTKDLFPRGKKFVQYWIVRHQVPPIFGREPFGQMKSLSGRCNGTQSAQHFRSQCRLSRISEPCFIQNEFRNEQIAFRALLFPPTARGRLITRNLFNRRYARGQVADEARLKIDERLGGDGSHVRTRPIITEGRRGMQSFSIGGSFTKETPPRAAFPPEKPSFSSYVYCTRMVSAPPGRISTAE